MRQVLIIRFGEFTIKGENRQRFEHVLWERVHDIIYRNHSLDAVREYGRIYVTGYDAEHHTAILERLSRLFGVHSLSPALQVSLEQSEIEAAAARLIESFAGQTLVEKRLSFKVQVKRINKKYPLTSQEIARVIGGSLLRKFANLAVDVRDPQIAVHVELRDHFALVYLHEQTIHGAGGFPAGVNGSGLILLSGGIDSPVAAWLSLRKGMHLEAVHFHSYPHTSEQAREKVIELARVLSQYSDSIRLHLVSFTNIQEYLRRTVQERLWVTVMRRAMMRLAEQIAVARQLKVLITGESLGQVASQTLPSLNLIERAVDIPVLRPLLMMDKQEIVDRAEQIGTYEISILPFEDCCTLFVPKHPSTNPNVTVVEESERRSKQLSGLMEEAIQSLQTMDIEPRRATDNEILHPLL